MIKKIIDFSARNPLLILLVTAFAIAWGWWTLQNTPWMLFRI